MVHNIFNPVLISYTQAWHTLVDIVIPYTIRKACLSINIPPSINIMASTKKSDILITELKELAHYANQK